MATLIKLSEYVDIIGNSTLHESYEKDLANIYNYTTFITNSLQLGFFVPCDLDNNILEQCNDICACECKKMKLYRESQSRVLFKDFWYFIDEDKNWLVRNSFIKIHDTQFSFCTIEDLIYLTPNLEVSDWVQEKFNL